MDLTNQPQITDGQKRYTGITRNGILRGGSYKCMIILLLLVISHTSHSQSVTEVFKTLMVRIMNDPPASAKSTPARNVHRTMDVLQRNAANLRPEILRYDGTTYFCPESHVQGITRLNDDRFLWAHSSCGRPGHWIVSNETNHSTSIFTAGNDNHPSPLQACGNLVLAPLGHMGVHAEDKQMYLMFFKDGEPNPMIVPLPKEVSANRAGITYHHQLKRYYVAILRTLYYVDLDPVRSKISLKEVKMMGGEIAEGEAGVNLVYDETDNNIYSFSFHKDQKLYVRKWELSADGKSAAPFLDWKIPFNDTSEGTSWRLGGGMKVYRDKMEIYKTDRSADAYTNDYYVAVYTINFE